MSQYQDTLGYAQLNFSGVNVPESQPMAKSGRKSFNDKARATILSIYGMYVGLEIILLGDIFTLCL